MEYYGIKPSERLRDINYHTSFRSYLRRQGKSQPTIKRYAFALAEFLSYCRQTRRNIRIVTALEPERVENYIAHLVTERKLSPSTVNGRLTALSSFARFLIHKGILPYNPLELVSRFSKDGSTRPSRTISRTAVEYLRREVNSELLQVQERLIVELLYTGVTLRELISTNWDGRPSDYYAFLSIGNRNIKLHPEAQLALKHYLILRPILCGDQLIVGDGPDYSLTSGFVYNLMRGLSRRIKIRVHLRELRLAQFVKADELPIPKRIAA